MRWGQDRNKDDYLFVCFFLEQLCGGLTEMRKAERSAQENGSSFEQVDCVGSGRPPMEILSIYLSQWVLSVLKVSRKEMQILKALTWHVGGNLTYGSG